MPDIDPTARVSAGAELGKDVRIGPYAIVADNVVLGEGSVVSAHAVLKDYVRVGPGCMIGEHAVLGGLPQDTRFRGEKSFLELDDGVTVREFATLHRATGEGERTYVAKGTYIMAYSHVSHNCRLGKNVTVANSVQLAGHVEVGDAAFLGGATGVHQFVRIGRLAMVGAHSYLTQDIPPFLTGSGHPFFVLGPNRVGMERAGFPQDTQTAIKHLFKLAYKDKRPLSQAVRELNPKELALDEVKEFIRFIDETNRGIRLKCR
ncbi:acyl-ACP--UDP-N-acetylglucosamine O-acyltransferase [candidate division WOR-3 bacterium]|uniref:Acyl-ACP--UDP-N-acetylglucosamine O-acyltransferase n=1 Tax=candidate division WOR-3 bacterium TaxID=2052148 RepID=A0A9D5KC44_UNCW3|nr:acyl-ACP--UDP-N-acetylglucosamine O-acyltransferase [candidate division WOR-3 bacterium]MBD3365449.1 acyl-ACP--UDP-N-acetylglucosamine O-acyltransferase [candidate division WOR-3 bacterium]